MIKNYLTIIVRSFFKYRLSNLLNISGLAFGLACCILCYMHIQYETGFDNFHINKDRIFRIFPGKPSDEMWVKISAPIPPVLKNNIPEIEDFVRFANVTWSDKAAIESEGNSFFEPYFMMADPSFFKIFSYPLKKGDANQVLNDLNSVVISATSAKKLFGDKDPIGKIIRLKELNLDFQVSGVMQDLPEQTHLRCDYLISFENLDRIFGKGSSGYWNQYNYFAYLLLHPNADKNAVKKKIDEHLATVFKENERTFEGFNLQAIQDIHFQYSRGNLLPAYDKKYIYLFCTVAIIVLLIACINYINLSITLAMKRIKEIGVRKAIGASKKQLILQFINESISTAVIALIIGIVLLFIVLPFTNIALNSKMQVDFTDPLLLSFMIGITSMVGLISGSYLAFYVNAFKPTSILKGMMSTQGGGTLQRFLIVIQFSISLILITSSFFISSQMKFMIKRDLGFNQESIVNITIPEDFTPQQISTLKTTLKQSSNIVDVASSDFTPGKANWHQTTWWEGQVDAVAMYIIPADQDFLRVMNIELREGADQEITSSLEKFQYVLNEAAVREIGWDKAKGKLLSPFGESNKKPIVGVVKDFNFRSLHHEVEPLVLVLYKERSFGKLSVKLASGSLASSMKEVEKIYKQNAPGQPFEFTFLDESIGNLYKAETRVNNTVLILTIITVGFSLFGIYALISFSIENRTKEIAIRKVLGIAPLSLVTLFAKRYYALLAIAMIIAVPITAYIITQWLNNFSYRIPVGYFWFAMAFGVIAIAITAIGLIQYISINRINAAKALKCE